MADLKNELSWSMSRMGMLHSCKRQYYHRYYGFWGGWSYDAPDESRIAYRFAKMHSLPTLCGVAVHETIANLLFDILETGAVQAENPAYHARKEILTRTWLEAEQELWKRNPKKHPPIFELYYGPRPSPEALKEVGRKCSRCVNTFLESDIFKEFSTDDTSQWLAIEKPLNADPYDPDSSILKIEGKTIWCLPDFARRKNGIIELWDWKTGSPRPADRDQLHTYALFAREIWGAEPHEIRLFDMYLNAEAGNAKIVEHPCDENILAMKEKDIREDLEVMRSLLSDPSDNLPHPAESHFPMTENRHTCDRCYFKELCGR